MHTEVCDLLGIEYPIFAFSHCRDVVAAVTNSGGMGVLGATSHNVEELDQDLAWIESQVSGRPYGVDLALPAKYEGLETGGLDRETLEQMLPPEHRKFVDDILTRYGIGELPEGLLGEIDDPVMNLIGNVTRHGAEPLLDVCFAHRMGLLASALGAPPPDVIERSHNAGVPIVALAGTARHAQHHSSVGVDLIVAQGTEAGGHTGEIGTMVLVPDVVDAVSPTPVLAAGGIATGRQIAASLALGAKGVWCGSVWLTTAEAETNPVIKKKFLAASSSDTIRSRSKTGKTARMLRSAWTDEWDRPDAPKPLPMPLQSALVAEALVRIDRQAADEANGAFELTSWFVGQVVGRMNRVRPVREVMSDMVLECADALGALSQ